MAKNKGGRGDDVLRGGKSKDVLKGFGGNDKLYGTDAAARWMAVTAMTRSGAALATRS